MGKNIKHSFMNWLYIGNALERVSAQIISPVFYWITCSFDVSSFPYFIHSGYESAGDNYPAKIFSHFESSLHSVRSNIEICCAEAFSIDYTPTLKSSCYFLSSWSTLQKMLQNVKVFGLTWISLMHFMLSFFKVRSKDLVPVIWRWMSRFPSTICSRSTLSASQSFGHVYSDICVCMSLSLTPFFYSSAQGGF